MCTVTRRDFVAGSTVLVAGTLAPPWELWKRKALR
jgi:hypothetical protein